MLVARVQVHNVMSINLSVVGSRLFHTVAVQNSVARIDCFDLVSVSIPVSPDRDAEIADLTSKLFLPGKKLNLPAVRGVTEWHRPFNGIECRARPWSVVAAHLRATLGSLTLRLVLGLNLSSQFPLALGLTLALREIKFRLRRWHVSL